MLGHLAKTWGLIKKNDEVMRWQVSILSCTRVHSARLLIRDVSHNMGPSRSYSKDSTIQGDKRRRDAGLEGNGRGLAGPGDITQ